MHRGQLPAVCSDLPQRTLHRVQVAADLSVKANLALAATVGHRNHDRILVDIQAHIVLCLFHALVLVFRLL
jgi:hypothetical protein